MPQFDGTGPMGQGAMTGKGTGRCGGARRSGFCRKGMGRGLFSNQAISPTDQITVLENEEKLLSRELEAIKAEKEALKKSK